MGQVTPSPEWSQRNADIRRRSAARQHSECRRLDQTIWLLAPCRDAGSYDVILSPPLPASPPVGSHMMTLTLNNDFGGLHYSEKDVTGLAMEILPTVPPGKWRLKMTGPSGRNLQVAEVEDLLLGVASIWV